MFEITTSTEVRVVSVTNRIEKHGDDDRKAVSIGLELTDANTSLDVIDPKIREALYKAVEGQEDLPGVEPATPVLRCNAFEKHALTVAYEGWTLTVEDGFDASEAMVFGGAKVDKFVVEAKQGGSVVLRFRVGTSDVDAEKLGKLAMHNGESIWIQLVAPKPGSAPIDGSVDAFKADHPDAGDLFAAQHGDPGEADSEGGDPDVDRDEITGDGSGEALPPIEERATGGMDTAIAGGSRTFEAAVKAELAKDGIVSEPSRRTARGRAATRAALEAGQP